MNKETAEVKLAVQLARAETDRLREELVACVNALGEFTGYRVATWQEALEQIKKDEKETDEIHATEVKRLRAELERIRLITVSGRSTGEMLLAIRHALEGDPIALSAVAQETAEQNEICSTCGHREDEHSSAWQLCPGLRGPMFCSKPSEDE